ncbi:MAG: SPOR domain-containing protein [Magnetococcales bacterium]|nr:SPOR domain-containing protein [Magnetococcales bacterium]
MVRNIVVRMALSLVLLGLAGGGEVWGAPITAAGPDPLETARAELRAGRYESASDGFMRILSTGEPTRERRLAALEGRCEALTRLALAQKRPDVAMRAVEECSSALHLESGVARIWRLRGVARLAAGQPEQALINLNHALRLDPADGVALRHRGLVQLGLGRHAEAESDFHRAARLEPDQAWHAFNRGLLAARSGKLPEAVEAWRAFELARGSQGREWLAFVARRDGGDADARRVVEAMQRTAASAESKKPEPLTETAKKEPAPESLKKESEVEPVQKEPAAEPAPSKKETVAEAAKREPAAEPAPSKKETVAEAAKREPAVPSVPLKEIMAAPARKAPASDQSASPKEMRSAGAPAVGQAGGYEFRLGSFQDRGNLESTLRAMSAAGLTVREETVVVGERRFFRVTAGPFVLEAEAKAAWERASKVPGVHPEPVRAR